MIGGCRLVVPAGRAGMRLDAFLRAAFPELPARSVRYALAAGEVRVAGERARKGRRLIEGEVVTVARLAEAADWLPEPGAPPGARVLYDDGEAAVLEKPAGIHTEPLAPREGGTLAGFLRHIHPRTAALSPLPGLTLLTRLDRDTSGAVLAALSERAYAFLLREREEGRIRKTYCCLVRGGLEREMIIGYVVETRGGERVRVRRDALDPDPLRRTVAVPVERAGTVTLVRATIARGARHQVRAHLAAAGFPIVGDGLYGAPATGNGSAGRLMLHATEVAFRHPLDGREVTVASPLPAGFAVT